MLQVNDGKHLGPSPDLAGTRCFGFAFRMTLIAHAAVGQEATDLAEFRPDTYVDSLFFGEGEGF
jgi:hypothetical protein